MHTIRYSEIEKMAPKEMEKFGTKEDLLNYQEKKTGKRELTTFLIPGFHEVQENLKTKKIGVMKKGAGTRDEFEHMTNWKRVFETIW